MAAVEPAGPVGPVEEAPSGGNLSAADAAVFMGGGKITAETMRGLARRKKIGHVKVGRETVFPIPALRRYIDEHTVQPVENPWGLTDAAAVRIRADRPARTRRAS